MGAADRGELLTAGERVAISCPLPRILRAIEDGADGCMQAGGDAATVAVEVEDSRAPFDIRGWNRLGRGAWHRNGDVVLEDVATSGFDLLVGDRSGVPTFVFRSRPRRTTRLAAIILPARAVLLRRAVLLQYPALWAAGIRGRVPLHASVCRAGGTDVLLAGPGGVGKSSLIVGELAAGGGASSDNLCVSDGVTSWGVVEPLRSAAPRGGSMPYRRVERHLENRIPTMVPEVLAVIARGDRTEVRPCPPDRAARALVAGTYMAGELRRYWAFASTLALATGRGPAHPAVTHVADRLARQLRCVEITLAPDPPSLSALLAGAEETART